MLCFSVPKKIERPERASESIAPGETRGNLQIHRRPEGPLGYARNVINGKLYGELSSRGFIEHSESYIWSLTATD